MTKILDFKPKEKKTQGDLTAGTLYEMNQQLMQNMKPLTHLEIASLQSKIEDWFNMIIDTYAMLLCHERRDYTIFHLYETENVNPPAVAAKEFFNCLNDRGEILAIDEADGNAWEIWLRIDNIPYCYYLFRYDDAVIEC